jgi:IS30 family transposase
MTKNVNREEIIKLKKGGMNARDIAKKFGITPTTVYYNVSDEYRRKRKIASLEYVRNKCKESPTWNAEKQREFRKNHPGTFNRGMARFYLRRLSIDEINKLVEETLKEKVE